MANPRAIHSARPFSMAKLYMEKGWSVLPLPEKRKEYPPKGFTGRAGKFADAGDIENWLASSIWERGNIALRLGNSVSKDGILCEVIGIDVDAHSGKSGAQELKSLISRYGPLPDTWISSSRVDGVSGIRFYLVPMGFAFKGKASDSIDIIQRVHRYAVVYPSWHPAGSGSAANASGSGQYCWYRPGLKPIGTGASDDIPEAKELPLLPDEWLVFLTAGKERDTGGYGSDLDSTDDEIKAWGRTHFNPPLQGRELCPFLKRAVKRHIEKIDASPSNHDKLTAAHWELFQLGAEGHSGAILAVAEVEKHWLKDVDAKQKRAGDSAKREVYRSRLGTLRKIKATAEAFATEGFSYFNTEICELNWKAPPKLNGSGGGHWINCVPFERDCEPEDYDGQDLSQAKFLKAQCGEDIRWIWTSKTRGYWIIYDGKRWRTDEFEWINDLYDRACYIPTKVRLTVRIKELENYLNTGLSTDPKARELATIIKKLKGVVSQYRNESKTRGMLTKLKSLPGIALAPNELNQNPYVFGMKNGKCIELNETGFDVVDNQKDWYITLFASDYMEWKDIPQREKDLWQSYLDMFLPDKEYRRFVQKCFGYTLLGANPERISLWLNGETSTGKSTMINGCQGALRDLAKPFDVKALLTKNQATTNPQLGERLGCRMIHTTELGGETISAELFKRLAGNDEQTVTYKFENKSKDGTPRFTMVFGTNKAPNIPGLDAASRIRMIVLPFNIQVTTLNDNKNADEIIKKECNHVVLHWLLSGWKMYVREKFREIHPDAQMEAQLFFLETSDIARFLDRYIEVAPADILARLKDKNAMPSEELEKLRDKWTIFSDTLWRSYYDTCMENNEEPIKRKAFERDLSGLVGIKTVQSTKKETRNKRLYRGLKWKIQPKVNQNA